VIVLDAPPAVLRSRKQELPASELARVAEGYRSLARWLPNVHAVDASLPLPEVVARVETVILDFMATRTRHRLAVTPHWRDARFASDGGS
jgi:hypothetical protein